MIPTRGDCEFFRQERLDHSLPFLVPDRSSATISKSYAVRRDLPRAPVFCIAPRHQELKWQGNGKPINGFSWRKLGLAFVSLSHCRAVELKVHHANRNRLYRFVVRRRFWCSFGKRRQVRPVTNSSRPSWRSSVAARWTSWRIGWPANPACRSGRRASCIWVLARLSQLEGMGRRNWLIFWPTPSKGLYYICTALFAVMRGGGCAGSVQPSCARSNC